MSIIGIDLGTTNSLVSVWENGKPVLIPNHLRAVLTPSAVSFKTDDTIWVGAVAKENMLSMPERSISSFKRYMGTNQQFKIGKHTYRPQELSALVLRQLKKDAEEYLHQPVEEAIISVPAYFNDEQRYATKEAGILAGLKVERLINEPSAAALACRDISSNMDETFLVVDFGGGTLDVSVVECFDQVIEILAVAGDNHLGGDDFDKKIAEFFCEKHNLTFDALSHQQQVLLIKKAENCKRQLTEKNAGMMEWQNGEERLALILTQEQLIWICAPFMKQLESIVRKAIRDSGMDTHEIDKVVLVGGTCKMPIIRQYISEFLGIEPEFAGNPDEIVALGAGTYAGIKERQESIKDIVMTDICPFTLGLGVYDPDNHHDGLMSPIIERNSVLPVSKAQTYSPLSQKQTKLELKIYQGESLHCSENIFLGSLEVPLPASPASSHNVLVRFTYDINGILEVEAKSHGMNTARKLIVNNHLRMNETELKKSLKKLNEIKNNSREIETDKLLLLRAENLYKECLGEDRELIQNSYTWFRSIILEGSPSAVHSARQKIESLLEYLEQKYGIGETI